MNKRKRNASFDREIPPSKMPRLETDRSTNRSPSEHESLSSSSSTSRAASKTLSTSNSHSIIDDLRNDFEDRDEKDGSFEDDDDDDANENGDQVMHLKEEEDEEDEEEEGEETEFTEQEKELLSFTPLLSITSSLKPSQSLRFASSTPLKDLLDQPDIASNPLERLELFFHFATSPLPRIVQSIQESSRNSKPEDENELIESLYQRDYEESFTKSSFCYRFEAWKQSISEITTPGFTFSDVSQMMEVIGFPSSISFCIKRFDYSNFTFSSITDSILKEGGIESFTFRRRILFLFKIISLRSHLPPSQAFHSLISVVQSVFDNPRHPQDSTLGYESAAEFSMWSEGFVDHVLSRNHQIASNHNASVWSHHDVELWIKEHVGLDEIAVSLHPFRLTGFVLFLIDQHDIRNTLLPHSSFLCRKRFLSSLSDLLSNPLFSSQP